MINHLVNVLKSRLIQDKEAKQTIAIVGNMIEIQDDSRFRETGSCVSHSRGLQRLFSSSSSRVSHRLVLDWPDRNLTCEIYSLFLSGRDSLIV